MQLLAVASVDAQGEACAVALLLLLLVGPRDQPLQLLLVWLLVAWLLVLLVWLLVGRKDQPLLLLLLLVWRGRTTNADPQAGSAAGPSAARPRQVLESQVVVPATATRRQQESALGQATQWVAGQVVASAPAAAMPTPAKARQVVVQQWGWRSPAGHAPLRVQSSAPTVQEALQDHASGPGLVPLRSSDVFVAGLRLAATRCPFSWNSQALPALCV